MKKIVIILIILCLIPLQSMNVSAASKIKISHTKATIKVNESIQLSLNGTEEIINWSSSNEDIAIVEFGNVKGLKPGKATITAEVYDSNNNFKKFTCVITVKKETESKPLQKFIDTLKTNAGSNKKDSLVGSYRYVEHYAVVDINSDGVDELIVYKPDKELLIVLAVKGNKVIKAGEISDAISYYGYSLNKKTGAIVNIGSYVSKGWYFKENKLKTYNDQTITKFIFSDGEVYYQGKEEKSITKKKYSEIANKYYNSKDLSPITFASTVKLNKTKLSLVAGESVTLKLLGTNGEPNWMISGSGAAVDEKGKVSAFREGSVTIGANLYGKVYECDIKILNPYLEDISYDYKETYEYLEGGEDYDLEAGRKIIFRPWKLRMIIPKNWTASTDRNPDASKDMVVTLKPKGNTENSTIKVYMIEDKEYGEYGGKYSDFENLREEISKVQFSKKAVLKELVTEVSSTAKITNYREEDYEAHNHEFYKVEYEASYTVNEGEFTCKKTIYDSGFKNYRILVIATENGEVTSPDFSTVLNDFINTLLAKE